MTENTEPLVFVSEYDGQVIDGLGTGSNLALVIVRHNGVTIQRCCPVEVYIDDKPVFGDWAWDDDDDC